MPESLFRRREEKHFPDALYRLSHDLFALVQHWEPPVRGAEPVRLFAAPSGGDCSRSSYIVTRRRAHFHFRNRQGQGRFVECAQLRGSCTKTTPSSRSPNSQCIAS